MPVSLDKLKNSATSETPDVKPLILLATVNARYSHASLGLRYLLANMGTLREQTQLLEFVLGMRPIDMAEAILRQNPTIVGLGVYLWNIQPITELVGILKTAQPSLKIVLGGPEVSYESEQQSIVSAADYVITGWGDISFPKLCGHLLNGPRPLMKIIPGEQPPLDSIKLPYQEYTEEDIKNRFLYVEASRGCPYKCEFCLSALDKTAWPFALSEFLLELDLLWRRGARHFRFVDRTFNLNLKMTVPILSFFLERLQSPEPGSAPTFIHFELIPDHLPDSLKEIIALFPPGVLQFEIGIQTLNPAIQTLISRRQNNDKALDNLKWLRMNSSVHLHVDLIAGLPEEDLASFAAGFNQLIAVAPHEIQVGILKKLRGAPISRHDETACMRYNPYPPYNVLSTSQLDFSTLQQISRFARYWDLIANSGRFRNTLPILLGDNPFKSFWEFSGWLFATTQQTHQFALEKLFNALYSWFGEYRPSLLETAQTTLLLDYTDTQAKGKLSFMNKGISINSQPPNDKPTKILRQHRHLQST